MFKFIGRLCSNFSRRVDRWVTRGPSLNKILNDEDAEDLLAIEQASAVIVSHQYLKHMAESRIEGRKAWRHLQQVNMSDTVNLEE